MTPLGLLRLGFALGLPFGVVACSPSQPNPGASGAALTEPHLLRRLPASLPADPGRAARRHSLLYVGHLTDPQVIDELSPVRVEYVDPAAVGNYDFAAAWRPQEALAAHVFDASVGALNARRVSELPTAGAPRSMDFTLVTGDLIDNMQGNELALGIGILRGGEVDPFSGRVIGPDAPCPEAAPAERVSIDAAASGRHYTGVQAYAGWPAQVPASRKASFWDPDEPAPAAYPELPRYPGLMDRAQQRFVATGLGVPYRMARGNHGALSQGRYSSYFLEAGYKLYDSGITIDGCRKMFPNPLVDPLVFPFDTGSLPKRQGEIFKRLLALLARVREPGNSLLVPADPTRRFVTQPGFTAAFADTPDGAGGYAYIDPDETRDSNGWANYYAWDPAPGLRFVSIDTNSAGNDGAGGEGNLDDPQFRWLERTLGETSDKTLVVVFGHHPLETMTEMEPDEPPGPCPPHAVCDGDPRCSQPIHLGLPPAPDVPPPATACGVPLPDPKPARSLRDLLLDHPNVVLYVNGHTHVHQIEPFERDDGGRVSGFWQVTTGSLMEWPQQGRTLEITDNRDGTLSIFATVFSGLPDVSPPPRGADARTFDTQQLLAVAKQLAALDWEWRSWAGREAAGRVRRVGTRWVNIDANVELLIRDPRPGPSSP